MTGHESSEGVGRVENEEIGEDEVKLAEAEASLRLPTTSTTTMRATPTTMTMPTGSDQTDDGFANESAALSVDEQGRAVVDNRKSLLHEAGSDSNRRNDHHYYQHQQNQNQESQNRQHRHQYQERTKKEKKSLPNRNGVWQGDEGGYYDVSFVEDPWLSLLSFTS